MAPGIVDPFEPRDPLNTSVSETSLQELHTAAETKAGQVQLPVAQVKATVLGVFVDAL